MAEIGVIASGMGVASLGLQLMDGIRKLKEFWDEVKNAPEDIQYAIGHLETLSSVLSEIHTENPDLPPIPSVTATKCLNLCQRGVDMLSMTVKDLNAAISKGRRIGGAKVVLKKDTLEKFRNRLRDAQYMLILARQTYSEALQHEYHKIQIETAQNNACLQQRGFQELGSSITRSVELLNCAVASKEISSSQVIASDDESHDDTITSVQSRTRLRTTKQTKLFQIKLKMPQWFSHTNYTWDFSGFQAPSGWTFSFRQYYIVDYDSPAVLFTIQKDLTGLQLLLKSKKATPFDKFSHGETLLVKAFKHESHNIVELSLNEGAEFDDSCTGSVYFLVRVSPDPHTLQRLSYYWPKDPYPVTVVALSFFDCKQLASLLDNIEPTWRQWSLDKRMDFALQWCSMYGYWVHYMIYNPEIYNPAYIISLMLQQDQLNEACCKLTTIGRRLDFGFSLVFGRSLAFGPQNYKHSFLSFQLQYMAVAMNFQFGNSGECHFHSNVTESGIRRSGFGSPARITDCQICTSIDMIERLIKCGADVFGGGLLASMVCTELRSYRFNISQKPVLPANIRLWLEILDRFEIDLLRYGKVEHDHFLMDLSYGYGLEKQVEHDHFLMELPYGYGLENKVEQLISFTYVPSIEDWMFWFTVIEPYCCYYRNFRSFWELVDHPERGVPGAWCYDDDWDP